MWQSEKHTFLPNFTLFNNTGVRSCDFSTAEQALEWSFLVIFAPKLGILYK